VTPVVQGDTVIFSGLDHPVQAVRVAKGADGWTTEPVWENEAVSCYMSSPVLADGRIFVRSNKGELVCLDVRAKPGE